MRHSAQGQYPLADPPNFESSVAQCREVGGYMCRLNAYYAPPPPVIHLPELHLIIIPHYMPRVRQS